MATSQAATSGTAVAVGGTANPVRETVVGSHMLKIDGFSRTKDLGVGKCIKSSTFSVGGHGWYIECYPCGVDEKRADYVSLFLCLSAPKEQVGAECYFYSLVDVDDGDLYTDYLNTYKHTYNPEDSRGEGCEVVEKGKLESHLKDDCIQIGCQVSIFREFRAVPPPDLHRHLSDLVASGMPGDQMFQVGGEIFTLHRGLPGPSTHVAASTISATGFSTVAAISAKNVAGSHVLTIERYSQAKNAFCPDDFFISEEFDVGGRDWYLKLYPKSWGKKKLYSNGKKVEDTDCLPIFLLLDYSKAPVKVRFELTLLTIAREVISSTQSCYTFTDRNDTCRCYLPFNMEPEFSLFQDTFHVKCDVTIVKEITPLRPTDLHRHFGDLLASQVGTDVEFEVGGDLFSAHKLVLATRSTAFMVEFFGQAGVDAKLDQHTG